MDLKHLSKCVFGACVLASAIISPGMSCAMDAARAKDFLGSIGVNVHIEYTDSRYASVAHVLDALDYIGINHVRDSAPWHGNQGQQSYGLLADNKIRFDVFFNRTLPQQMSETSSLAGRHPDAVELIEGPNEINNFPITYMGQKGLAAAQAYQAALYSGVKADPELARAPVLLFTDWPVHSGRADAANMHSYPRGGAQPADTLAHDLAEAQSVAPNLPAYCTEAGYSTLVEDTRGEGVDEAAAADLTANLVFDAFAQGVKRTYIYELFDEFADPSRKDMQKHFGLFRSDYSPKPSATFFHNLAAILRDDGGASFEPRNINIKVEGAKSLLLEDAHGRYSLILWREPRIWNGGVRAPVPAAAETVNVQLNTAQPIMLYDPMRGAAGTPMPARQVLTLTLSKDPVIIRF